jgi:hypothetical protein
MSHLSKFSGGVVPFGASKEKRFSGVSNFFWDNRNGADLRRTEKCGGDGDIGKSEAASFRRQRRKNGSVVVKPAIFPTEPKPVSFLTEQQYVGLPTEPK